MRFWQVKRPIIFPCLWLGHWRLCAANKIKLTLWLISPHCLTGTIWIKELKQDWFYVHYLLLAYSRMSPPLPSLLSLDDAPPLDGSGNVPNPPIAPGEHVMWCCSHGTPVTLHNILAAQHPRTATLPPIESTNPFALLKLDNDTSLPNSTTTGVTTGRLGDLIGAKTTADDDNIGVSSFDLLRYARKNQWHPGVDRPCT